VRDKNENIQYDVLDMLFITVLPGCGNRPSSRNVVFPLVLQYYRISDK